MRYSKSFDVIVVGGGHAGTEAALAAARMDTMSDSRNKRHVQSVTFHSLRCHGLSALLCFLFGAIPALM